MQTKKKKYIKWKEYNLPIKKRYWYLNKVTCMLTSYVTNTSFIFRWMFTFLNFLIKNERSLLFKSLHLQVNLLE